MAQAAISDLVRQMDPVRYTTREAARKVGVSKDTVDRWRRQGVCSPSDSHKFGELEVWLYSEDDIQALREVKRQRKRKT